MVLLNVYLRYTQRLLLVYFHGPIAPQFVVKILVGIIIEFIDTLWSVPRRDEAVLDSDKPIGQIDPYSVRIEFTDFKTFSQPRFCATPVTSIYSNRSELMSRKIQTAQTFRLLRRRHDTWLLFTPQYLKNKYVSCAVNIFF